MSPSPEFVPLHERAADNLRFIRETMERAGSFTAVPGKAGVGMGAAALVAAVVAAQARLQGSGPWLRVWLLCLALAMAIGVPGIVLKARRFSVSLFRGAARKFLLSMLPALVVGGLLTIALPRWDAVYALPGIWMLCYGASVMAGGAFSVRIIPVLGLLFLLAGALTLFLPERFGDLMMGLSFGVLHVVFGWLVARRHGG